MPDKQRVIKGPAVRFSGRQKAGLLAALLLSLFLGYRLDAQDADADAEKLRVRVGVVGIAGTGRYFAGRWGVVQAAIANPTRSAVRDLVVVTPDGSGGLQYAREIEIPAQTMFETIWPVRMPEMFSGRTVDFQYLHFPGGVEDGVIRHTQHDSQIPSFFGMTQAGPFGLCGWIAPYSANPAEDNPTHHFLRAMRYVRIADQIVTSIPARDISERLEVLAPFDQMGISDPELMKFPQACEALRDWLRRGGRMLITLDSAGSDVAQMLLGDSLPLTVVGETTTNEVNLEINPKFPENQYPDRVINRKFPEPVRYLRVIPAAGETIWSVDGWPVAMHVPVGSGVAVLTTISPEVFFEPKPPVTDGSPPHSLIPSSRKMLDLLFTRRVEPLISEATASAQAAAMVGYEIPSRQVAFLLLLIFPVLLISGGVWLQRRAAGERLAWVLPAAAVIAALPSIAFGIWSRSIAPTTLVETAVVNSAPGEAELVADGYATVFVPTPTDLRVSSAAGAVMDVRSDETNQDYKRLVWTSPRESHWENLKQPTGLRTLPFRAEVEVPGGIHAFATFDENGVRGQLLTNGLPNVLDPLLVGNNPDRLSLRLESSGDFRGGLTELLAPGQFVMSSVVSESQTSRAAMMEAIFANTDRVEPFPAVPSVLFWSETPETALAMEQSGIRRSRTTLFVQPLQLRPPESGRLITIPSTLLNYRSLRTANGSYSSVFDNVRHKWNSSEAAGQTLLEIQIPSVCLPFEVESAEVSLLIRAASRAVTVDAGEPDAMQRVHEMKSPQGTQTFSIPAEIIRNSCRSGFIHLQIEVSDLDSSMKSQTMSGEQDDSWHIERSLFTFRGRRQPESTADVASTEGRAVK